MDASEIGTEIGLVNETDLPDNVILQGLQEQMPEFAQVQKVVNSWAGSSRRRNGTPFNQDQYSIPDGIFDQFRVAAAAARYDDVVSNAVETTEQLAFKRIGIECGDEDINNIATQMIDQIDLTQRMREIWRDLFIVSQSYVAVQWGRKDFKTKGTSSGGRPKKKVFKNLLVPVGISTLDPLKIIPVGNFLFGNERLVYIADDIYESTSIEESLAGPNSTDLIVRSLFESKYTPSPSELTDIIDLVGWDVDIHNRLFVLNPDNVFRITSSRSSYQRFADVRMTSVFELLDLKHNLRESDRSDILGNLNCIVLVKKGTDDKPANDAELAGVASQMKGSARNSLMISDHRIEIEIITKKTDKTLQPERHNTLDSRITARLFQILSTGNYAAGTAVDDSSKLFKVIAASMEARRDNIRDALMDKIIEKVWDKNEELKGEPSITFYPRRIALDFDPNYSTLIFDLYTQNALSHQTLLDELDIDQGQEAYRMDREKELYGDKFAIPLAPGAGMTPEQEGRQSGGNKNGGGQNPDSGKPSPSNAPKDPVASAVKKAK